MQASKTAFEPCTDAEQSFAIVFWGWLRSYTSDYNGQKGELFAIEEVGKLLYGKEGGNHAKNRIPLTQAQCRSALKRKVRTFCNNLLMLILNAQLWNKVDGLGSPVDTQTMSLMVGLKKQC